MHAPGSVSGLHFLRSPITLIKLGLFLISLALFLLAVLLLKDGAQVIAPAIQGSFAVSSPVNSMGFGWLAAYVLMSGSPVAAAGLAFFDAGIVDALSAFTLITGSRLGASFLVLILGFVYVLRGRDRAASLTIGLLSLIITGTTHLASLPLGIAFLHLGTFDHLTLRDAFSLSSRSDALLAPITAAVTAVLPHWTLFFIGLLLIMVSFSLFDRCLPEMSLKESHLGHLSQLVYRPWVMLLLGAGLTVISMSVSISLGILVPLSERGFIRRENVIPYIMGANITTFVDTLLVALLLDNPMASTIVLVEMVSMAIVSLLVLVVLYRPYERGMLHFVDWSTARTGNLALFMVSILLIPLLLLLPY